MNTMTTPQTLDSSFTGASLPLPAHSPVVPASSSAKSKRKHLTIAAIASIGAFGLIVVLLFHAYVAYMLAYPYVAPLASNPQEAINLAYEDIVFASNSGDTTVSGWFVPAPEQSTARVLAAGQPNESRRTVVFSHGYGANREESWVPMYDLTNLLHGLDYNVLLFDYGYASKQYKAPATGGREESQQLLAAVQYARDRGAEDIIVWGFSMGAGTALQTAMQTDDIDAMILDSLFLPSPEALFDNLNQFVPLPRYPSLPLIQALIPLWSGSGFGSIPAEEVIASAYPIPIMIMHGTSDSKAPYTTAEAIAANQSTELSRSWIVDNGQHEMLFRLHAQEYIQRAALFLSEVDQYLQGKRESSAAVAAR